jgi:hypothetical protein
VHERRRVELAADLALGHEPAEQALEALVELRGCPL